MGFTHIEFLPLSEYPYDGSWGYQASGYYALTSRYGSPADFQSFVNACHKAGIGVIMDFVPVHFAVDAYGLSNFDGEPVYESRDKMVSEWGSYSFDFTRGEVCSFLMDACLFWCEKYHVDGIRIDAVRNLIYKNGREENGYYYDGIQWLRKVTDAIHLHYPNVMMIAEDSSSYPGVTNACRFGGLGFDYKWNLGWMHDSLKYFKTDPLYRYYEHYNLTLTMTYFYSEHYILPLSHDENVHGKKTIIEKMHGTYEERFQQSRVFYTYMFTHPGKKLNFMGNEFAMMREFDENRELDWNLLDYPMHQKFQRFFRDLNSLYKSYPCLWKNEYNRDNFHWISENDAKNSIYIYERAFENEKLICIFNCSSIFYEKYGIVLPQVDRYQEIWNSDYEIYGGLGRCNQNVLQCSGNSLTIQLAPYSAVILKRTV